MSTDALEVLAANLPMVAYLYAGEARTLVYVGAPVELLTGCTPATLLAQALPLTNHGHPDDRERVELAIAAALADRQDFCTAYRMGHADGSWRWVEDRGRGVYDERGLAYLAGTLVDISERVAAQGRRREFDAQCDRNDKLESLRMLAGGIAHEFNNALLTIMGNLELAKLSIDSNDPVDEMLDDALEAARHAARKTSDLLIYSGHRGHDGDREASSHSSRRPSPGTRSSRAATVLVVDDEQMIRRMIRRVLEGFGCRVIEGADRDQGSLLISAHAESIDLAILDVNLPQGKGTELFSQLRARRPRVPVLFSSGFEQPDVSRGDDPTVLFLAKPYRSQALVEHVTTLLELGSS